MLVDIEGLKSHYGDDTEIVGQLIDILADSYGPSLDGLKDAIENSDYPNIKLHAHTLKGMLANFFALTLKDAAFYLEQCGSDESLKDEYLEKLKTLEEGIPTLIEELKQLSL